MARVVTLLLTLLTAVAVGPAAVLAADGKQVGPYLLQVRWLQPAIAGFPNAVVLTVAQGARPVAGLEATLTASMVLEGKDREMPLQPLPAPGSYVVAIIPTTAGTYSLKLAGQIEATPVNDTLGVADGLAAVAPARSVAFPGEALPEQAQLFNDQFIQVNGRSVATEKVAERAEEAARQARTVMLAAAVLAVLSMVTSAVAFAYARPIKRPGER